MILLHIHPFKSINHTFPHHPPHQLFKHIPNIIQFSLPPEDVATR
ncbi:hypothetical protein, partial [Paenibacillus xylanexedens]